MREIEIRGGERLKAFIKGRWFPLVIAIVGILVIAFVMALFGWRITYAPELENSWDAVSAIAAWAGAIGTVAVLVYNHKAIELSQRSIQQAIDLQLLEKRLELYAATDSDQGFLHAPNSLSIAYSEEVYVLYVQMVELCRERWEKICEFAVLFNIKGWETWEHGNLCYDMYDTYTKHIENEIKRRKRISDIQGAQDRQVISLEKHKADTDELHMKMCRTYFLLESKMKEILDKSMNR